MKTREEAIEAFERWLDGGIVGNIIFYHAPGGEMFDCIVEQVVKIGEMKPGIAAAFASFMNDLEVDRGEVFTGSDGQPDRIRLTRSWDG